MSKIWIEKLEKQNACREGLAWASKQESPQTAWDACERADWMLWALSKNCGRYGSKSHRRIVLTCVAITKKSLKYIKKDDKELKKACKNCLDVIEKWANNESGVTLEDVEKIKENIKVTNAVCCVTNAVYYTAKSSSCFVADSVFNVISNVVDVAFDSDAVSKEESYRKYAKIIRGIKPRCPRFRETW